MKTPILPEKASKNKRIVIKHHKALHAMSRPGAHHYTRPTASLSSEIITVSPLPIRISISMAVLYRQLDLKDSLSLSSLSADNFETLYISYSIHVRSFFTIMEQFKISWEIRTVVHQVVSKIRFILRKSLFSRCSLKLSTDRLPVCPKKNLSQLSHVIL